MSRGLLLAASEASPGPPVAGSREAEAHPDAAAAIAAWFGGGSMLNLLSERCADLYRKSAVLGDNGEMVRLSERPVKRALGEERKAIPIPGQPAFAGHLTLADLRAETAL